MTRDRSAAQATLKSLLSPKSDLDPFPWQSRLLDLFLDGRIPTALDIPTGLGKTSVIAIWLAARSASAPVPRRLVYVVDRRAVVDQSTRTAEELRGVVDGDPALARAIGLTDGCKLPISTLRGRFVDNREWLEDPSSPAIVVGTVDMIGSRLLFQGYGTSRRMRPFHAALLACDSLLVLDEAHLVPPFARLCADLAESDALDWGDGESELPRAPRMDWMALSATGRHDRDDDIFTLEDEDRGHPVVGRRLDASKRGEVVTVDDKALVDGLVDAVATRIEAAEKPERLLVFANRREHADKIEAALAKAKSADAELFVGARRIRERSNAARRLEALGFLAGSNTALERPAVLVATSAAEVGVDLDADHMIADVVSWDRMVQRLGRVNRRGDGAARVTMVATAAQRAAAAKIAASIAAGERPSDADTSSACLALLEHLPLDGEERRSLSPSAIVELTARARSDESLAWLLSCATSPEPLRPAVGRAELEAWAMTSLDEHTGRPEIAPWLRGWVEDEEPRTNVVWRHHLVSAAEATATKQRRLGELLRAAPVQTSELLETEAFRVADWLGKRWNELEKVRTKGNHTSNGEQPAWLVGVILDGSGEVVDILRHAELEKAKSKSLKRRLAGRTLVVRDTWGGLARSGLLDHKSDGPTPAIDANDLEEGWLASNTTPPFRVRLIDGDHGEGVDDGWLEIRRIPLLDASRADEDAAPPSLVVDVPPQSATDEESRASGNPQRLDAHHSETAKHAERLADRLGLDGHGSHLLALAARLHDEGKRATIWQRAFSAPPGGDWAKTRGPVYPAALEGYRHEFGSYLRVLEHPDVRVLDATDRDLVLHLIASHHGHARPVIPTSGCQDGAPTALAMHAADIADRFVRLQRRLGAWQLAWWEMLLRAADQQASRANDARLVKRAQMPEAVA